MRCTAARLCTEASKYRKGMQNYSKQPGWSAVCAFQETVIGRPYLPGSSVVAAVEEHFKDAKVYVFKKKKRKRYTKLQGHR